MPFRIDVGISLIFIFFLILLGIKSMNVTEGFNIDKKVSSYIVKRRTDFRTKLMKIITFFSSIEFVTFTSLLFSIYFIYIRSYTNLSLIVVATLGASVVNHILKKIFGRERPLEIPLIKETFYSFPSGHSMVGMAYYLTLAYIFQSFFSLNQGVLIYGLAIIIISLIGLSRIYLGVHWFSDVIGGYLGGYCVYFFGVLLVKYIQ